MQSSCKVHAKVSPEKGQARPSHSDTPATADAKARLNSQQGPSERDALPNKSRTTRGTSAGMRGRAGPRALPVEGRSRGEARDVAQASGPPRSGKGAGLPPDPTASMRAALAPWRRSRRRFPRRRFRSCTPSADFSPSRIPSSQRQKVHPDVPFTTPSNARLSTISAPLSVKVVCFARSC